MKSEQACRIIPCLDVTAGRVVKGVNFVDLVDAGDPVEIARRYDEQGADELFTIVLNTFLWNVNPFSSRCGGLSRLFCGRGTAHKNKRNYTKTQ